VRRPADITTGAAFKVPISVGVALWQHLARDTLIAGSETSFCW
jgi:hypothetical protein